MKKLLTILFGALFVFSFAASAFAVHSEIPAETQAAVAKGTTQITLGGEIRTRGWWADNIKSGLAQDTNNAAWYDQRVRLSVDANVAPGVTGFVQLETHSGTDGDKYKWGNGNYAGCLDSDGKAVSCASEDAATIGNPANVGGYQSTALAGNAKPNTQLDILQAWILYTGQGLLGIPAGLKVGHMPLMLGYGQFFNNTQYGDDAVVFFMDPTKELHVGLLTVKLGEGLTSVNGDDTDAYVALATYKIDDKNKAGINFTYANQSATRLKLQDLGLHADGNIAGVGYKVEGNLQFGSWDEVDFGGNAISLALNYNLDPVNVRLSAVRGSGMNENDTKIKEFVAFTGNTQNYSLIYEYLHNTTAALGATPTDGHAAGIANTTYFNLGADYKPMKEMGLSLDGYLFRATKALVDGQSKNAGWEVDAKMTYALAKNLSYQIDAGYFKTGKFFETGPYEENCKKSVTVLRHALTLSF